MNSWHRSNSIRLRWCGFGVGLFDHRKGADMGSDGLLLKAQGPCCSPELPSVTPTTLLLNLMLPAGSCCARVLRSRGLSTPRVSFTPPAALAACPHSLRLKPFSSLPPLLTNSILQAQQQSHARC